MKSILNQDQESHFAIRDLLNRKEVYPARSEKESKCSDFMKINVTQNSITDIEVDVIVNPAISQLLRGGGLLGVIH